MKDEPAADKPRLHPSPFRPRHSVLCSGVFFKLMAAPRPRNANAAPTAVSPQPVVVLGTTRQTAPPTSSITHFDHCRVAPATCAGVGPKAYTNPPASATTISRTA